MKATLVFIFGPNLKTKTLLQLRPKLNNEDSSFFTSLNVLENKVPNFPDISPCDIECPDYIDMHVFGISTEYMII